MRKSHKLVVAAVAAAAGIAVIGATSAFTDSNTFTPTTNTAGYASSTVTGITVDAIHYVVDSGDASILDKVTFDTSNDVTTITKNAVLTLNSPTATTQYSCTITAGTPSTIACNVSADSIAIDTITSTGLTVTDA